MASGLSIFSRHFRGASGVPLYKELFQFCTMSSFLSGFKDTDVLFLEFDDKLSNVGGSFRWMRLNLLRLLGDVNSFDSLNWRAGLWYVCETYISSSLPWWADVGQEYVEVFKGALQDMQSNYGRTRMLDKSSLTIKVASLSRFYNDNTRLLRNEMSQSTMWSYSRKHMLGVANSFCRLLRMDVDEIFEKLLGRRIRLLKRTEKDLRAANTANGRNEEDGRRNESSIEGILALAVWTCCNMAYAAIRRQTSEKPSLMLFPIFADALPHLKSSNLL
ncbi:NBS-LRR type resistance protein [Cucumis melo var. makuwa]|uniref:NBS-LRR type resistance protein n=1 Tax=Cucumis melo var. makuwa TaxID=1194695 RepID=A0A5A7U4C2_CUCMM|nr:NBS-LRR type resistance protein [Cucumis melo var. makuwa]TYK28271.1 NBS-LRR type resistance protein [Cucumis melo var. makuwa]